MPAPLIDVPLKETSDVQTGKVQADKLASTSPKYELADQQPSSSQDASINLDNFGDQQTQTSPSTQSSSTSDPAVSTDISNVVTFPGSSTQPSVISKDKPGSKEQDMGLASNMQQQAEQTPEQTEQVPETELPRGAQQSAEQAPEQPGDEPLPELPPGGDKLAPIDETRNVAQPDDDSSGLLWGVLLVGGGALALWALTRGKK